MEFSQETYELVEQYLSGSLKGAALQTFKERLATDQALAKEVEFQREMQFFLAETPENKLRKNLEKLNQSVELPPKQSKFVKYWGLLLLPIGLLAGWWILIPSSDKKIQQPVNPTRQPVPILLDSSLPVANQSSPTETFDSMLIDEPLASPPPARLQAFEASEMFEKQLKQLQINYGFEVLRAQTDFDYKISTVRDSSLLDVKNRFTTTQSFDPASVQLGIWSNVRNESPIFNAVVDLKRLDDATFQLDFQQKIVLSPGRYYWTLQAANQTNFFFIQPFFVRLVD